MIDDFLVSSLQTPCVYYDEGFMTEELALELFESLLKNTEWTKTAKINRWVSLYDESDATDYQYRDAPSQHKGTFPDQVGMICKLVEEWYEQHTGTVVHFNVCLLNYYEDGHQRIGWHTDREEIGRTTPIASISLGATREFAIRAQERGWEDQTSLMLKSGSLLIMENICQHKYVHALPKQLDVSKGRINLTFRCKTDTTSGEVEHQRRDNFFEQLRDMQGMDTPEYRPDREDDNHVFGDSVEKVEIEGSIRYLVQTHMGTEHYCAAEIRELLTMANVHVKLWRIPGYVAIATDTDHASMLLKLRSALRVLEYHDHFMLQDVPVSNVEKETPSAEDLYAFYKQRLVNGDSTVPLLADKRLSFRVSTERIGGPHLFQAPDVEYEIGGAISEFYGSTPRMRGFDVQVRADIINDAVVIGTQLHTVDLSMRHFLRFRNLVTIKVNLAYCMLRCARVESANLLLDPFCGSGTILLEAMEINPNLHCVGLDLSGKVTKGANDNVQASNCGRRCTISKADARSLRQYVKDESVDAIVSNLPWGVMTGSKDVSDLQSLYEVVLRISWYTLKPGGRLVFLVLRGMQLCRILRKLGGRYRVLRANVVRTTNNLPCIVVAEKLANDTLIDSIKNQLAQMSSYVNVSKEMYHAIHMENVGGSQHRSA